MSIGRMACDFLHIMILTIMFSVYPQYISGHISFPIPVPPPAVCLSVSVCSNQSIQSLSILQPAASEAEDRRGEARQLTVHNEFSLVVVDRR